MANNPKIHFKIRFTCITFWKRFVPIYCRQLQLEHSDVHCEFCTSLIWTHISKDPKEIDVRKNFHSNFWMVAHVWWTLMNLSLAGSAFSKICLQYHVTNARLFELSLKLLLISKIRGLLYFNSHWSTICDFLNDEFNQNWTHEG